MLWKANSQYSPNWKMITLFDLATLCIGITSIDTLAKLCYDVCSTIFIITFVIEKISGNNDNWQENG